MTDSNHMKECFHNPSSQCTDFGMFHDFLFRRNKLMDGDTDVAVCACCGEQIVPPKRYCSKKWLVGYVIASVLIGLMYGAGAMLVSINQSFYYASNFAIGLLAFYITIALMDRIASSVVFARCNWELADLDMTADGQSVIPETRKQHCRRQKSLKRIALHMGMLPLFLLFVIFGVCF